jgi:hydroxymethylpyrimidine pyrophosphatase-like HAD family hydrolase
VGGNWAQREELVRWAITDKDGRYSVRAGPGEYQFYHLGDKQENLTVKDEQTIERNFHADRAMLDAFREAYESFADIEKAIRQRFNNQVSAVSSWPTFLDVTDPTADKGTAVRRLSELIGVKREQIATIGDMPTDLPMFAAGGLSIAMGQAGPDVKAAARFVANSNDDEGFADAINRIFLEPKPCAEFRAT